MDQYLTACIPRRIAQRVYGDGLPPWLGAPASAGSGNLRLAAMPWPKLPVGLTNDNIHWVAPIVQSHNCAVE